MHKIQYLPHTADMRIKLEAGSLESLFRAGAISIAEMLQPGFSLHPNEEKIKRVIAVNSVDTTTLLIDFLSDLLTLSYTEKAIFCEVKIEEMTDNSVVAKVYGKRVDGFEEDIKAVTYHEAEVRKNRMGNWETLVIIDI